MCIGAHWTSILFVNSKIIKENVLLLSPIFDQNFTSCSSVENIHMCITNKSFLQKNSRFIEKFEWKGRDFRLHVLACKCPAFEIEEAFSVFFLSFCSKNCVFYFFLYQYMAMTWQIFVKLYTYLFGQFRQKYNDCSNILLLLPSSDKSLLPDF